MEDIPEALREQSPSISESESSFSLPWRLILLTMSLGLMAIAIGGWFWWRQPQAEILEPVETFETASEPEPELETEPEILEPSPDHILGHLTYAEAPESELTPITADGRIKLRSAAAEKFQQMQAAARSQGVILTPISGYRSISDQNHLFFEIKEQRSQVTSQRAEVSAPPGWSEHHTGYAIDIGDGNAPATNLQTSFEQTAAFKWLEQNAAKYSFELSFPKGNLQGISYEPWHWRFVGDRQSLETFYQARNLRQRLLNQENTNGE